MKTGRMLIVVALLGVTACSSLPTSQATKDLDVAPVYTQEEKDAMTEDEKIAAYNDSMSQGRDKLVCRREVIVGTHFKQTVCRTQGEIEDERKSAQEALGQDQRYRFDPTLPNATRPE